MVWRKEDLGGRVGVHLGDADVSTVSFSFDLAVLGI